MMAQQISHEETRQVYGLARKIGHKRLIEVTYQLAHAAGWDAGNRSMRAAGRSKWNHEDHAAASAEFSRIMPMEDQN
jgi:hypothetical protein